MRGEKHLTKIVRPAVNQQIDRFYISKYNLHMAEQPPQPQTPAWFRLLQRDTERVEAARQQHTEQQIERTQRVAAEIKKTPSRWGDVAVAGTLLGGTAAAGYGLYELGALTYIGYGALAAGGYKILEESEGAISRFVNQGWLKDYINIPNVNMKGKRLATQEIMKNFFTGEYVKRFFGYGKQTQRRGATA